MKPDYSTLPQHRVIEDHRPPQVHYQVGDLTACGKDTGHFKELSGATTDPADCPRCLELAQAFGAASLTQQRVQKGQPMYPVLAAEYARAYSVIGEPTPFISNSGIRGEPQ